MNLQSLSLITLLILLSSEHLIGGYTTPNTGVNWTLDSLVVNSAGTLTGSFPNYTLNDTLTVSQNDRVTFRAGAVVSVAQGTGKGFTVFGILRAVGTVTDTIVVKGVIATAAHRGFRFEDSSVDSACVISYCRIQDAVEGVHCLNANTLITNTMFTNNSSSGVRCFGASPTIRLCTFVENKRNAITANLGSSPLIENNTFARNNSENTSPRNQISIGPQGVNNPVIRNNEVYNLNYFRTGAISLVNVESIGSCAAVVEGNYLHDNSFGILSQGVNMSPMIRYNRIENSRINPDPLVAGSGISIQVGGATNAPIITGNILKDNYWGITLVSGSGLANSPRANLGDLSNPDTSDDGWNLFINNHNGGVTYQLYNNGTQDIPAQNNWWGTADSTMIEQWIVHRSDSAVFGRVSYLPFIRPEMGRADSFVVRRISQTELQLRWGHPPRFTPISLSLQYRLGPPIYTVLASLPGTTTSYTWAPPPAPYVIFRLVATNRYGTASDTVLFNLTAVTEFDQQPREFSLKQNYPNPFNPVTTIQFTIPEEMYDRTSLRVYDVLGREVATLVNEEKGRGAYSVQFDANKLASGVYFYRLMSGGLIETKKLLLTR